MALIPLLAVLTSCGSPGDLATLNSYAVVPNPPVVDQNMTMWIDYTLSQDVFGGTAYYTYNLNGVPYTETNDLCTQTQCPIMAGINNESSVSTFPLFTGKLVMTIDWEDANTNPIWCLKATFTN